MRLDFLGMGSAFNTKMGNTSGMIRRGKSLCLIDCGGMIFDQLKALEIFNNIDQIDILITHTHPDHVGSLGDLIFYAHYVLKLTPRIHFPDESWMRRFMVLIGVEDHLYVLDSNINHRLFEGEQLWLEVAFMAVTHVPTMPSFGLLIKDEKETIYYSGDANGIGETVLKLLFEGGLDRLYQDTCGLDYEGNAHMSLRKLKEVIPVDYRHKVWAIHHDELLQIADLEMAGFAYVKDERDKK